MEEDWNALIGAFLNSINKKVMETLPQEFKQLTLGELMETLMAVDMSKPMKDLQDQGKAVEKLSEVLVVVIPVYERMTGKCLRK